MIAPPELPRSADKLAGLSLFNLRWNQHPTAALHKWAALDRGVGLVSDRDTAARHRQSAEGLRNLASDKTVLAIRDRLLSIAEQYDRLATMLEGIDGTSVAIERAAAMTLLSYKPPRS
jgi:hypothetical protein